MPSPCPPIAAAGGKMLSYIARLSNQARTLKLGLWNKSNAFTHVRLQNWVPCQRAQLYWRVIAGSFADLEAPGIESQAPEPIGRTAGN